VYASILSPKPPWEICQLVDMHRLQIIQLAPLNKEQTSKVLNYLY
jgi:hypothetical protein